MVTRSGDEAVVSLCNQWFLDYGKAREALANLNMADEVGLSPLNVLLLPFVMRLCVLSISV